MSTRSPDAPRASAGSSSSAAPSRRCACARRTLVERARARLPEASLPLSYTARAEAPAADQAGRQPADRDRAARRGRRGLLRRSRPARAHPGRRRAASPRESSCATRRRSGTASRRPPRSCAVPSTRSRSAGDDQPHVRRAARRRRPAARTRTSSRGSVVAARASAAATPATATCARSSRTSRSSTSNEKAHTATLRTVLQLDASGAGRPEDVVARARPAAARASGRSGRGSSSLTLPRSLGRLRRPAG